MSTGTIKWFNRTIGAGFIRTDDGENVLFLNSVVKGSDPCALREGLRVRVGILKSANGLSATDVRVVERQG